MARIAIAGAGLAGRLMAWALLRAGHEVLLADPAPGPEPAFDGHGAAAFSAAGMLSPLAEQECGGEAVARLGWRSLALWPRIVDRLSAAPRFAALGSLLLAHPGDRGAAQRALARMTGAQPLAREALSALEPALAAHRGLLAWQLPGEGLIDTVATLAALHRDSGAARWLWGQEVLEVGPGRLRLRDGRGLEADWAVDTRGLGGRPQLPLRGVRGETVWLDLPGHGLRRPLRLLHPRHRVYLVPRDERRLIVGATEIESEDRSEASLKSAVELMSAAHSLLPALAEARILRLDRNLRPALPDNLPHAHAEPGLLRLNGLYRHGWLLAPALVDQLLRQSGLATLEDPHHADPTR